MRAMNDLYTPILNWVRDDDPEIVLTGGAVRVGKLVRLQAQWQPWGTYNGPERFTIRTRRTRLGMIPSESMSTRVVCEFWADVDGPPKTHSLEAWQAGVINPSGQRRYYFTDLHKNKSGELTVSSLEQYTDKPTIELEGQVGLPAPLAGTRVVARAGRARVKTRVGATTDPRVRIRLLVTTGDGGANDLSQYLDRSPTTHAVQAREDDLLFEQRPLQWRPVFEGGEHELVLDVDEDHPADVTVVQEGEYVDRSIPFKTAFALRVENADAPERYVISDVVTVEGGGSARSVTQRPRYPEGSVLFRA